MNQKRALKPIGQDTAGSASGHSQEASSRDIADWVDGNIFSAVLRVVLVCTLEPILQRSKPRGKSPTSLGNDTRLLKKMQPFLRGPVNRNLV